MMNRPNKTGYWWWRSFNGSIMGSLVLGGKVFAEDLRMFMSVEDFEENYAVMKWIGEAKPFPEWITDRKPFPGDLVFAIVQVGSNEYMYADKVGRGGVLLYDGRGSKEYWNSKNIIRWMYANDVLKVFGEKLEE